MVRIGFRVNANFKTGSGHLQRCLTLASGLKDTDQECEIFFLTSSSKEYLELIIQSGFTLIDLGPINTTYENTEATEEAVKQCNIEILIIDSYEIDEKYLKSMKEKVRLLAVFDDFMHLGRYHAHAIINLNLYAHLLPYVVDEGTCLLLGTEFAQLRSEFDQYADFKRENPEEAKRILVTFGGSDIAGATLLVVHALKSLPTYLSATIILGKSFRAGEQLAKEIGLDSRFIIMQDIRDISGKMAACDLAITSPSTTFYELAFFKIPSILITCADNQALIGDYAGKNQLAISFGDINSLDATTLSKAIANIIIDKPERDRMSARMEELVDGLGRFRLAEEILQLYNKQKP